MHRLFAAIRPPGHILDLLVDAMEDSPDLGWVSEDNLHLTLRFIGEVERPQADDIADLLSRVRFPAFELRISGLGRFDKRNGGAIWAGVEPRQPVSELAAKIDRACVQAGLEPERRAFHPHITIARWNRRSRDAALRYSNSHPTLASERFRVENFILFESHLSRHGAHYEKVATYTMN